ncbi:MAG: LysR family transcriptional regulator [Comamonadaceae bacterium]|nr:MAG: LysR family transcriptional regulator [Comamonadaceae bacterium]
MPDSRPPDERRSRRQKSGALSSTRPREIAINLRQLQYFARIVEAGNITRAAEQLFVAQPALGMQIRQLEQELGVSLLSRHSRGVSPTRAGQVLYERACEILRLVDETGREVTAAGRLEREGIVLGLTNGFTAMVGRELVMQSRRDLPAVKLSLVEERSVVLVDGLERHEIDIALAYEVHERPGVLRIALIEEELLFVSAPPRAGDAPLAASIDFSELAGHGLVLPGKRDGVRDQVLGTARRLAIDLNVMLDVSSISMMKNMVAHGDACAVMPYGNAIDDIARGQLAGRRITHPALKRTLYLVRSIRRAPFRYEGELLEVLSGICRQYVQKLGPLARTLEALDQPLASSLAALQKSAATSSTHGQPQDKP